MMDPSPPRSATWVDDGDEFAVVALTVKLNDPVPLQQLTPHHWAFSDDHFEMPDRWQEWLGTERTKEVEGSTLFL